MRCRHSSSTHLLTISYAFPVLDARPPVAAAWSLKYDAWRSINSLTSFLSFTTSSNYTISTWLTKISLERLHHPSSCWTMMANHLLSHQERRACPLLFSSIQSQVWMGFFSFFLYLRSLIYSALGSYGCTKQACQFRNAIAGKGLFISMIVWNILTGGVIKRRTLLNRVKFRLSVSVQTLSKNRKLLLRRRNWRCVICVKFLISHWKSNFIIISIPFLVMLTRRRSRLMELARGCWVSQP